MAALRRRRNQARLLTTLSVVALLVGWQVAGIFIDPLFLPQPTAVVESFFELAGDGKIGSATWVTFWTFVVALMGGILLGSPVGILLGYYPTVGSLLNIQVRILYSIPVIALFPLFILWFGLGVELRLVSILLSALLPAIINAESGVRSVDRTLIEVAKVYGATQSELFRKIIVPATVPFIAAGFKIAIGRAIVTTVAIELISSQEGLGGQMAFYGNQLQMANYFVPLVIAALLSLSMYLVGDLVERRFSAWRTTA